MGNWSYNPTYRSDFTPVIAGSGAYLGGWNLFFFWETLGEFSKCPMGLEYSPTIDLNLWWMQVNIAVHGARGLNLEVQEY